MLHVRPARASDLPAIVDIYNQSVVSSVVTFDDTPVTATTQAAWFEQFDDMHPLFVAESAGKIAGYAYYLPFRAKPAYRETKELTIYVDGAAQRRGIATALYERLIAHAREHRVHALIGVLGGDNPASVALHRKFGFELVGHLREVGRKFGRYVDTHYYELLLLPPD